MPAVYYMLLPLYFLVDVSVGTAEGIRILFLLAAVSFFTDGKTTSNFAEVNNLS